MAVFRIHMQEKLDFSLYLPALKGILGTKVLLRTGRPLSSATTSASSQVPPNFLPETVRNLAEGKQLFLNIMWLNLDILLAKHIYRMYSRKIPPKERFKTLILVLHTLAQILLN